MSHRLVALLLLNLAVSAISAEILRVDINDSVDSPTDTATGFTAYTLLQETLQIPPFTIELNPSGGADLDDLHRTTPADGAGLSLAPLFRDAAFVAPDPGSNFYRVGLDALITGLVPGKRYAVTAWSFDSGSPGTRSSDWSLLGLGGALFGVNNYTFDGSLLPAADTANRFTMVGWADLAGRLTVRGRQSSGASTAQLFLNGFTIDELPEPAVEPAVVLAIDFNDRGAAGVDNTLPGFQEFLLAGSSTAATTTRTFGSYTVTLTATNTGAVLDDRLRTTPTNSGPFTEQLLLRDFVFAVTPGSTGLDARIAGLVPGRQYLVELWSFDATSSNLRTADWTLNGAVLWDDYQFDGANAPATNDDYKMVGVAAADGNGELLVGGRLVSGSTAVFLNALRISELAPAAIVDFGKPIIAEFMAENDNGVTDEDGDTSDWIEIWNSTPDPLDLGGWHLTDDSNDKDKWTFPSGTLLAAQARLIVWASGKDRRATPAALHTNFALNNATGAYLGLVRPNGLDVASEFLAVPRQRANISYGVAGVAMPLTEGYFENPTPGARNGGSVDGFVADTIFNPDRGFYSAPVNVQISCATPNAVIRYTTDGSEPTATSPLYPGGAGVAIATTTVLRAKAFLPPLAPTNADTHTYIFNAHVAAQPAAPAGWPATWGIDSEVNTNDGAGNGTVPADYEMDPQVINSTLPGYGIPDALAALPALSIALDPAGFHSAGNGIHSNPRSVGDTWERAASIELINPDGSGFQERAGIRVHGNSSRRPYRMQKHSFRIAFRNIYGAGKLNYRFFDETKVDEFDKLVLRACFTDSWGLVSWDPSRYRPDDSVYFRDVWMKRAHIDMGYWATANNFVHLYINGLYWGIYNPCERIDEVFCVDHFGGIATDWDILADFNELKAGNTTAWNAMFAQATAGLASTANYQTIQQQLDVVSFADYYLLHVHADTEDWPSHNWYAIRNRAVPGDKWRWFVWDQEIMLDNHSINRIGATNANTPGALMQALRQNAEFRLLFADRAHRHLHNNGALSLAACQNRWQSFATRLDKAIVAESARWGDTADATPYGNVASKPLYTRQGDWLPTVNSVKNTYLPSLYNTANSFATIRKLRAATLYPNTEPPAFSQHGGNVPTNYQLAMTAPAGTIYYTLNGNDPREVLTGNPVGTAYTAGITLTQTLTVKARARNGTEWSALTEAKFIVGVAGSAANLSIAEIHYHPALNEEEEFIELVNRSAQTIDLTDVRFTEGIEFVFPDGLLLAPGTRVLVVRNQTAFVAQYGAGLPIAGVFIGALDNNGEQLVLTAADGSEIGRFTYSDSAPWPAAPDKIGRSLILRSANAIAANPASWRSSVATGGNPGATDSVPFNGAPLDDLDRDGLPALLEYTFGTSDTVVSTWALPTAHLETLPTGSGTDSFLTFTTRYNLAADHVSLSAEHSSDLGTWSSSPESVVFLGETIAPDGTARLKWRGAQPANLARPRESFRLRATLEP